LKLEAKVIGSRSWAQILVESGPRVGLQLGALSMARNVRKIPISRAGAKIVAHEVFD